MSRAAVFARVEHVPLRSGHARGLMDSSCRVGNCPFWYQKRSPSRNRMNWLVMIAMAVEAREVHDMAPHPVE